MNKCFDTCLSMQIQKSIAAHLWGCLQYSSSFSSFFFWFWMAWMNILMWACKETRKHVSEHSWLSGWMILSILAHLAHLAQSYFSLIFSSINTYNYSWFELTNEKICSDWWQRFAEKWPMLSTFFLTALAAFTGKVIC